MSHDDNANGLAASPLPRARHTGSPGRLERPSLFFGMEEDQVDDVDTDRVRLLPSEGRHRKRPSTRPRTDRTTATAWWSAPGWGRALVALMGLGAVAVLYSFVQVISQPHAMSAQARAQAKAQAQATVALEVLPPTAAGPSGLQVTGDRVGSAASDPAPARIETSPTLANAPVVEAEPAPRQATPTAAASADPDARHLVARAAADAVRLNAPAAAPLRPVGSTADAAQRPRANEDVALLEAMMRHASARKAPTSASEALQGCARLQGPEAAVCKAKACVQHPTAPQCHSEAP